MRGSCLDCVRKHLGSAHSLLKEALNGYPHHRWLAVGELDQAMDESLNEYPAFSAKVRIVYLAVMGRRWLDVDIEGLILEACVLAGDDRDLKVDPANSKRFAFHDHGRAA